jgi:hypothetical protein
VFGLKTVDGDDDIEAFEVRPMGGNGAEGAGNDLGVDAATVKFGQDSLELAVADEGVSAYERDVEGLVLIDDTEDVFDEGIFFIVGQLAEGDGAVASKMG